MVLKAISYLIVLRSEIYAVRYIYVIHNFFYNKNVYPMIQKWPQSAIKNDTVISRQK